MLLSDIDLTFHFPPNSIDMVNLTNPTHYIDFLYPPPRIVETLFIATLSLLALTIGFPIWYISPPYPTLPTTPFIHLHTTRTIPPSA
jgi:hypothetical protein